MNSMTGFGRAELNSKLGRFTVEVSSVNSRFLELSVRLPRPLSSLEPQVREQLSAVTSRGKVSLYVNLTEPNEPSEEHLINRELAGVYSRQLRQLRQELGLEGEITVSDLLLLPEVVQTSRPEPDLEIASQLLKRAVDKALKSMVVMRQREGRAMMTDMRKRLKAMSTLLLQIERRTRGAVKVYAERLTARVNELLVNQACDSLRLEEEIALFAERTDVAEECVRFRSHIDQFGGALKQAGAVGRRLNFILQEMNREVNTVGSKCAEFEVSSIVISLKEEIERLREQVQNIE